MGRQLSEWRDRARTLLGSPPETKPTNESLADHVRAAIRRFSADVPRIASSDFPGNGVSFDLSLASIAAWQHGFSQVEGIEYPADERDPAFLDEKGWIMYPSTSAPPSIRLREVTPASGQTARVFYSVTWPSPTNDPAVDLVPESSFEPVASLAAAGAAWELAGAAAGHVTNTIPGADLVGTATESQRWRDMARDLEKIYTQHVGAEGAATGPASGVTDWDASASWAPLYGGFLFRRRRR